MSSVNIIFTHIYFYGFGVAFFMSLDRGFSVGLSLFGGFFSWSVVIFETVFKIGVF